MVWGLWLYWSCIGHDCLKDLYINELVHTFAYVHSHIVYTLYYADQMRYSHWYSELLRRHALAFGCSTGPCVSTQLHCLSLAYIFLNILHHVHVSIVVQLCNIHAYTECITHAWCISRFWNVYLRAFTRPSIYPYIIHQHLRNENSSTVRSLVSSGSKVDARTYTGSSPLHLAGNACFLLSCSCLGLPNQW